MSKPITLFGTTYSSKKEAAIALAAEYKISLSTAVEHIIGAKGPQEIEELIVRTSKIVSGELKKNLRKKPITLFGTTYSSKTAAAVAISLEYKISPDIAKAHINGAKGPREIEELIVKTSKIVSGEVKRMGYTKPITLFGVTYASKKEAAIALAAGYGISLRTALGCINGDTPPAEIEKWFLQIKPVKVPITLFGVEYQSKVDAAQALGKAHGVNAGTLRRALHAQGSSLRDIEAKITSLIQIVAARAPLLRFDGRQYKSASDFAKEHDLCPLVVRGHIKAGNSLRFIANLHGIKVRQRTSPGRPTIATESSVRMSGWVWGSKSALLAYYNRGRKLGGQVYYDVAEPAKKRGWAFALQALLAEHYSFGNLLENNRFKPEIEADLPAWCLPIDQDRLGPLDAQDARGTPDWAQMPPGAVHEFYSARATPELVKTAQAMLTAKDALRAQEVQA